MSRKYLALVGELLLSAAALLLLFVGYQLFFTNIESGSRAEALSEQIQQSFVAPSDAVTPVEIAVAEEVFEGVALLYVPALKDDLWGMPILSGVTDRVLAAGVGHYPGTALPGEVGNFAIAGHRATNGEPFARFERLQAGDLVIVQTSNGYYSYELVADQKIPDSDVWVIGETPQGVISEPAPIITLTTCDPRWRSTQRWARWGKLVSFSETAPEELLR